LVVSRAEIRFVGRRIGPSELGEVDPQLGDLVSEVQLRGHYLHLKIN